MGVTARIVLYAPDEEAARSAAGAAFARIAALDEVMSDYRPSSELMRLSGSAGGPPVRVSADLFSVLFQARGLSRLSGGAFDVTAGPLVVLWRRAREIGALPAEPELRAASTLVGWEKLELDPIARTARLTRPGMRLDLGGIAKGYAADEALGALRRLGIDRALVELGGDIVVGAAPPGASSWVVTLHDGGHRSVSLTGAAISTSGDTEQYLEIRGRRYSHIVDPRTGVGLTHRLAVTIVAPSGVLADGLSTMLSVLGPRAGIPLVESHFPGVRVYARSSRGSDLGSDDQNRGLPREPTSGATAPSRTSPPPGPGTRSLSDGRWRRARSRNMPPFGSLRASYIGLSGGDSRLPRPPGFRLEQVPAEVAELSPDGSMRNPNMSRRGFRRVTSHPDANQFLRREYRPGFEL